MTIGHTLKRSSRARAMRVAVYPDARVVVTAPRGFSFAAINRFLAKHAHWIERALARTKGNTVVRVRRSDIARLKHIAASKTVAQCQHFGKLYEVEFKRVVIRAQKSRWGSCSANGTLRFNYKIAALPEHIARYIVVHELCHLREMNHSKKFWELVARTVPDHRSIRKELRNTVVTFR